MKQYHALIVFMTLVLSSAWASYSSYCHTEQAVTRDLSQALEQTLREKQRDVITPDTIRTFNRHLQLTELRGKAYISVDTRQREFRMQAHCSQATIFSLSDQRPAMLLLALSLVWGMLCVYRWREPLEVAAVEGWGDAAQQHPTEKERQERLVNTGRELGGLLLAEGEGRFYTATQQPVHLTPMQQQLMEMFFHADSHRLTKQEICEALWPKKPDASETLYTLIRRLKPIVEQHSSLKIEVDRGRAYELVEKGEVASKK